jgi:carboxyl-terminal processing protease
MRKHLNTKILLILFLVGAFNIFVFNKFLYSKEVGADSSGEQVFSSISFPEPLVSEKKYNRTFRDVVSTFTYYHYNDQEIDDELSEAVFEQYISALDTRKTTFLLSDIEELNSCRYSIDDALKNADTSFLFSIFNTYRTRAGERISFMIHQAQTGVDTIDFTEKEGLQKDRKESAWPKDKNEQNSLWKKYFKYDVLNLMLSEKKSDEIKKNLENKYQNQLKRLVQLDSEDAFSIFMNALSYCYDPHTSYLSPRSTKNFNIMMSLSLEGIGAVLQREDEYTKVVRLIPAGPAQKSKLISPGDFIVGVGQHDSGEIIDVVGWRLDDVVELIRGAKKTVVRLELIPSDAVDEYHREVVRIVRDTVKLEEQAVRSKVIDIERDGLSVKIGIIIIPSFYVDFDGYESGKKDFKSTARDVNNALQKMSGQGVDGILVDLRDNGGGALQEAISLTGLFVKEGPVVQIRDNRGNIKVYSDPDPEIRYNGPLVVLVNRMSASASEIFAGAIQDYNRGIVIGSRTYGKGTVQAIEKLTEGQIKLTRAIFYRISGDSTQHRGIVPDIVVPSIYDNKKIGESAMENAIPWDRIQAVKFNPGKNINNKKQVVTTRHKNRIKDDPGFEYLNSAISHLNEIREKKEVTLNMAERKKEWEKAKLTKKDMEEIKKAAIGKSNYMNELTVWLNENVDLFVEENEEDSEEDSEEGGAFDPILFESCNILVDVINMENLLAESKM